jgi:hypothetical protein
MTTIPQKPVPDSFINKENWDEIRRKLKEKFPELKDPDLELDDERIDEMMDKIYHKIGNNLIKTKNDLHKLIKSL